MNRLAVRAAAAWLGPGRLIEDAQIVCEGGLVTYAGAATGIEAADREALVDGFLSRRPVACLRPLSREHVQPVDRERAR